MMEESLLLIEDDVVFAQVLKSSLHKKGVNCFHVSNIEQASLLDSEADFNHIVLDLYLEGESGLSLLPQLRKRFRKANILVLTGYASIATTVQAIKLGADNYLPKPANASQILNALVQPSTASEPANNHQELLAEEVDQCGTHEPESDVLSVERLQWEHMQTVLAQNKGNISATARALGMHRRTLQRRLSKKPKNK